MARTTHQKVAEHLRLRIRAGSLKRGDRLPSFEQLHRQLGAARATVSKALGELESDGLVVRRNGSGVYVARTSPQSRKLRIAISGPSPETVHTDYCTRLWVGIQSAARRLGVEVAILGDVDEMDSDVYSALLAFDADTIIGRKFDHPVVAMVTPAYGFPGVAINEYDAGFLATSHLIELGHKRIGFMGLLGTTATNLRVAGYYAAMMQVSDETQKSLYAYQQSFERIVPCFDYRYVRILGCETPASLPEVAQSTRAQARVGTESFVNTGYANMSEWLRNGFLDINFTAILVQNDLFAEGVMACLQDHGYDIPGDVSVVGFDDERICAQMQPPLTSVGADMAEVGAGAVRMAIKLLDGEQFQNVTVPVHLSIRESTGPPKTS